MIAHPRTVRVELTRFLDTRSWELFHGEEARIGRPAKYPGEFKREEVELYCSASDGECTLNDEQNPVARPTTKVEQADEQARHPTRGRGVQPPGYLRLPTTRRAARFTSSRRCSSDTAGSARLTSGSSSAATAAACTSLTSSWSRSQARGPRHTR